MASAKIIKRKWRGAICHAQVARCHLSTVGGRVWVSASAGVWMRTLCEVQLERLAARLDDMKESHRLGSIRDRL